MVLAIIQELFIELRRYMLKRPRLFIAACVIAGLVVVQLLVFLLGWFFAGPATKLYTVSGRVVVDGKEMTGGLITFAPKAGRAAVGVVNADGRYSLQAAAGEYVVVVDVKDVYYNGRHESEYTEEERRSFSPSAAEIRWLVPEEYLSIATSPLRVTVKGRRRDMDIVVNNSATP